MVGCFLALFVISSARAAHPAAPVIGLLTAPSFERHGQDHVPASYVTWLQSAGARVIPVPSGVMWTDTGLVKSKAWSSAKYRAVFNGINGLVLPGGDPWGQVSSPAVHMLIKMAVTANLKGTGDVFPVWGTCAGFETLMILADGGCQSQVTDGKIPSGSCGSNGTVRYEFNSSNVSLPLDFTPAAPGSRLFRDAPPGLMNSLRSDSLTFNHHSGGLDVATFTGSANLSTMYKLLSTNRDQNGREFVSTVEGTTLPFYGVQWHPEKNLGEWGLFADGTPYEAINHSSNAMEASQYFADHFIGMARHSQHAFESERAVMDLSIYNYAPEVYDPGQPEFVQTYFFNWNHQLAQNMENSGTILV